jgi:hypothetical protein
MPAFESGRSRFPVMRVARPTNDIERLLPFYLEGLGCVVLARFADHAGFDGVVVGFEHAPYHLEFVQEKGSVVSRAPTTEHLLALYFPDAKEHAQACQRMERAGYAAVTSSNPYWDKMGKTFEDPDGYRVVLQQAAWTILA